MQIGQRVALAGILVSGSLAVIKILAGLAGHSTATVADGLESAGDVVASGVVFLGLTLAAKPADENHPYGHGRVETLTGLLVGMFLAAAGVLICYRSLGEHPPDAPPARPLRARGAGSFRRGQEFPLLHQVPLRAQDP